VGHADDEGVCIGKAGDRSAFTTVAEMNEAYGKRQEEWRKWDYRKGCHTMTRSVLKNEMYKIYTKYTSAL
jgi:hypothetical protein